MTSETSGFHEVLNRVSSGGHSAPSCTQTALLGDGWEGAALGSVVLSLFALMWAPQLRFQQLLASMLASRHVNVPKSPAEEAELNRTQPAKHHFQWLEQIQDQPQRLFQQFNQASQVSSGQPPGGDQHVLF